MIFNMGILSNLKRLLWLVYCGKLGLESWLKADLKICQTTYLLCIDGICI
jgi:branched-subunit amino acid transport protein